MQYLCRYGVQSPLLIIVYYINTISVFVGKSNTKDNVLK